MTNNVHVGVRNNIKKFLDTTMRDIYKIQYILIDDNKQFNFKYML